MYRFFSCCVFGFVGGVAKPTSNNQYLQLLYLLRRFDSPHPATHGSSCRLLWSAVCPARGALYRKRRDRNRFSSFFLLTCTFPFPSPLFFPPLGAPEVWTQHHGKGQWDRSWFSRRAHSLNFWVGWLLVSAVSLWWLFHWPIPNTCNPATLDHWIIIIT